MADKQEVRRLEEMAYQLRTNSASFVAVIRETFIWAGICRWQIF